MKLLINIIPVCWFSHSEDSTTQSRRIVIFGELFPHFVGVSSRSCTEELLQWKYHLSHHLCFVIQRLHAVVPRLDTILTEDQVKFSKFQFMVLENRKVSFYHRAKVGWDYHLPEFPQTLGGERSFLQNKEFSLRTKTKVLPIIRIESIDVLCHKTPQNLVMISK